VATRGAKYTFDLVAGDDESRVFTLYSDADLTSPIDLTGSTAVAQGIDDAGVIIWADSSVVVGDALGTFTVNVSNSETSAGAGKYGTWKLYVTWADTSEWSPVLGNFRITARDIVP